MLRPLPPLNSLRSFEAVAPQLSFSTAADEIHVTPSAVSQQIRALEELLGTRLFNRTRRSVALPDAAMRMLPDVQAGLESLADGAGVVLGRVVLAEGEVAAGRLARPFKIALPLDVSYFLVRSSDEPPRHEIQCFREWLFSFLERSRWRLNSKAI